jgi:Ca2+-transporting ATPase
MRTISDLLQKLPTTPDTGLTTAGVTASQQQFGSNRLTPLPREPLWKKFLEKFDEPIIKILLGAALLSMVVDLFKTSPTWGGVGFTLVVVVALAGLFVAALRQWLPSMMLGTAVLLLGLSVAAGHPSIEGLAVMIAVVLATGVAFYSEAKSDREFEVLNAQKDSIQVKVIRDAHLVTVPLEEVVVGDLVNLETGDEIPADGRVLKATDLRIDQSLMTGESEAVRKRAGALDEVSDGPDKPACVYRGTQVVDGVGQMMVTDVGDTTMIGQIAKRLSADPGDDEATGPETEEQRIQRKLTVNKELTPLQLKLQNLAGLISNVGYIAAVAIFIALIMQAIILGKFTDVLSSASVVLDAVVYMVIVIVVAVPEGLPMSVTVSLALAMQKMTRANSLVRQLVACETIGSATVICSDKTGTLTQNKMTVVRVHFDGQTFHHDGNWPKPDGKASWPRADQPLDVIALNAAVNSTANLEEKDGKLIPIGNSTEGSLLFWLNDAALAYEPVRKQFAPVYQIVFSSERKRMTTVVRYGEQLVTLVKGASEKILEMSSAYLTADGQVRPWTDETKAAVAAAISDAAGSAMRTLGFGYVRLPHDFPTTEEGLHERKDDLEKNLVFAGFVAIRDPIRKEVPDAVAECRAAGIEVKMITGDNIETARAIARDIGLLDIPDAVALTSDEFNAKSDAEIKELLPRLRVLARAKPLDKYRMVKLLQEQDQVVAMTGDGTNDAPSLKKADVGLAMGIAGTEVAKEASKIVLLDDSFATIVKAVAWGRSLYENIQRFIQFQLTINVSALTIAFLGPFFGVKPPFTVLQLLWINVIMDTFASIALCSEEPRAGLMRVKPKRKDENIVTPAMMGTIFSTAGFFVVVMMGLLLLMKGTPTAPGLFGDPAPDALWLVEQSGGTQMVPANQIQPGEKATEFVYNQKPAEVQFSARQVSLFFTIYVLFQVWNLINCRSLTPEESGLKRLWSNRVFLGIAGAIIVGQVLIVTFGGSVFKTVPLGPVDWLLMLLGTASVLVFAEVARAFRKPRPLTTT